MSRIVGIILDISTQNIEACRKFYEGILKFKSISETKDEKSHHIIFHHPELSLNLFLRITQHSDEKFISPSHEHLLVFYLNNEKRFKEITANLAKSNVQKVKSLNPYWDKIGATFLGPDGYRIVFCPGGYRNYKARVARPSGNIQNVELFYQDNYPFIKFAEFKDHEGFDGIMLGADGIDCHLEMTHQHGHSQHEHCPSGYSLEFLYHPTQMTSAARKDPDNYPVNSKTTTALLLDRVLNNHKESAESPFWKKIDSEPVKEPAKTSVASMQAKL